MKPEMKKRAAHVLAAAFYDYPSLSFYFPDPKSRMRRLAWYMGKVLNCAMAYGDALVTQDMSGVLFALPPGHTRLSQGEFIRHGFLPLPFVMGLRCYLRSEECEKFVAGTHDKLLNGRKHYYLWGLAADPKKQRTGAGTALLQSLIAKADAENMPIYLETHKEQNVAYYERNGFALIHKDTIPVHGLEFFCMLREPREAGINQ